MLYFTVYWFILIIFFLVFIVSRIKRFKNLRDVVDDVGILVFIFLSSLLVISIATKDPLQFLGIEIPVELEWLVSLLISGFGVWKFYLNPLKKKVYDMDREVGEVKISVDKVEKNVDKLIDYFLNQHKKKK